MVGHEHHPGISVEPGLGECVEQPADGRVGDGDRSVELGEILPDVGSVGQVVGDDDVGGVGRFVTIARVGPVRLEETGREQERLIGGLASQRVACSTTYSQ